MSPAECSAIASEDSIAIVGIGCRFPGGANNPSAFWELLANGVNAVREAPQDRPGFHNLFDPDPKRPGRSYSRWGGFLERVDLFDAHFFGISPREAMHIDPQHRLLLELVWESCEDAGIAPPQLAGSRTGVFIGISTHDYGDVQMYPQHRAEIDMHSNSGTATSIAANRISYLYDFRGPSIAVDTACSSALTAVHLACQSLRTGDCKVAFAGGVQLMLSPELTIGFCKASMLSRNGECRAFDASANGYVRAEGAGVVLLKPLQDALANGDPVYAVIRATAINQDGHTVGMTVPSAAAQQQMIEEALAKAGVSAHEVQYVEAHGTGTPVGDPIEATAIGLAMRKGRGKSDYCAIGSVKTNLGHLEAASGMPGLIKAALALRHRQIPASLHFKTVNSAIDLEALQLRVVTALEPWPVSHGRLLAGVNSFGFGGANAHAVLEAAPAAAERRAAEEGAPCLLALSAKNAESLKALAQAYADDLRKQGSSALADVCYTAGERRAHHDFRVAATAANKGDLAMALDDFVSGVANANMSFSRAATEPPKVVFVFCGMGPQWWGMGRQLRATEVVFRQTLERCDAALAPYSGWSLMEELDKDEAGSRVASQELAQVTNFAIQVALAALWADRGIVPDCVIGHSGGAMAAAYAAGIHSLDDALRLCFHRSRLQGLPSNSGEMLAVGTPFSEIESLLAGKDRLVWLAAVNAPSSITLAGDSDAIQDIYSCLQARHTFARILGVKRAYHGPAMDNIKDDFLASMAGLEGQRAQIPFLSDTTGTWASGDECDVDYWWRAIRQPVLFHQGIQEILHAGFTNFVEVGPHPVLTASIVECLKEAAVKGVVLPSIRRKGEESAVMLRSLGSLYCLGCSPRWSALRGEDARVVSTPHYAWQRERHWFEPGSKNAAMNYLTRKATDHPILGSRLRSARPGWESLAGVQATGYLQDHMVQGSPVYPGAAYMEMALASQRPMDDGSLIVVRNAEFIRPLVLNREEPTHIQFSLDAASGKFEVHSGAATEDAAWAMHARGAVSKRKRGKEAAIDLLATRERVSRGVDTEEFYHRMAERSLLYGPSFRGVKQLWTANREALGLVTLDNLPDVADYHVHPALLDAAFQVMVAAVEDGADPLRERPLFLPTRIREFTFHAPPGGKFWVVANTTELTDVAMTANLLIVGEDGRVCVDVQGFTATLVKTARSNATDSIDNWLYDYRWEPAPAVIIPSLIDMPIGRIASGEELEEVRLQIDTRSANCGWNRYYTEVEKKLNELAAAYIAEALPAFKHAPAEGWRTRLVHRCQEILQELGEPEQSSATLMSRLIHDYPAHSLDVELLSLCGARLGDVASGLADGKDVLFTEASLPLIETFYQQGPASAFYNVIVADIVADFAASFTSRRPIKILEVGAGTGGTTAHILPRLDPQNTSYVFSDVSPIFLDRARSRFLGNFPFLSTEILDITGESDRNANAYDLIVAANVVHATPHLRPCVEHLRDLLAPGGALLLLEITGRPLWLDVVFGGMEGWWKFEDRELRSRHPLLRGAQWKELLQDCGFETPAIVADSSPQEPAQTIIIARKESGAAPATKPWLIFADEGGVGQRLAAMMAESSISSDVVYESNADLATLRETLTPTAYEGVFHLWSLNAPSMSDVSLSALPRAQSLSCGGVLSTLQGLVLGSPLAERTFVLVTAGAQAIGAQEQPALLQSPVWGFGRTVMKELPNLRCRLADLSAERIDEELAALLREYANQKDGGQSHEEEVAFRGADRFVRRLRPTTLSQIADAAPVVEAHHEAQWRAEILTVGSLDSIVFRRTPRQAPGPLQVEVAVEAASLNFRDVVLATGAIPGLESEDSFGNRALGLDLAGVVTRCGDGVTHLRPGDEVFGNARGAFASYAIANSALLVRKPALLSHGQAASISVAFVTAHYALRYLAHLSRGESILIHAASGGVGLAAIQMARMVGARIFATAGSPEKRSFLESLGVTEIMDSRALTFAEEILERTNGRGVDVILNSLSGEAIDRGMQVLAPFGRFVEIGKFDILQNNRIQLLPFKKNLSFFAVDLDRMCHERPNFVGQLLQEVATELSTGLLEPIPCTTFPMKELSGAMRFMAQAKHIGKVVLLNNDAMKVRDELPGKPPVRADGTYLITGGLGGVGLLTARMLVEQGAGSVVLIGRKLRAEAESTVNAMRATGARIEVLTADVTDAEDVERVLQFVRAELPPLRGIVHAAMVLEDTPLTALDQDGLNRVMAPKVAGAWNLHQLTLKESLDFFVLYSSIASLLGNTAQANYASANAFLDSFATYRRRLGLPATTINWGVISGAGYVARHPEIEEALNRQGYKSFTENQVMDVVSQLLRHNAAHIMAARIDWKRLEEFTPRATSSPRIKHLVPATISVHAATGALPLRRLLDEDGPAERRSRLEKYLQEQVGRLLGTRPGAVEVARPITDLGLDSLIAVELTVVLERDLGVQIPSARLLSGVSLETLATDILGDLWTPGGHGEELSAAKPPSAKAGMPATQPEDGMEMERPELASEAPVLQDSQTPSNPPVTDVKQNGNPAGVKRTDYGALDHRSWTLGQQAVRMAASAGFSLLGRISVEGFENIPSDGPCLLVVNHLSMADVPLVLTLLPRRAIVLANARLQQNRLLDWFLSDMGQAIYVNKDQHHEPLQQALTVLRSNGLVAIAPEGTRSKAGGLLRGNTGAAYLATQVDVPVVPLVAWGQEKWRERGTRIRRIPIQVCVGPPLRFPQGPISASRMRAHTDRIMTTLAAMLPPEYRGVYADLAAREENRELERTALDS